jgi:hypothetical protein
MVKFSNTWADVFKTTIETSLMHLAGEKLDYLEIGIFEGQSAHLMFENILTNPESTYTGIDPWILGGKEIAEVNLRNHQNVTIISEKSHLVLEDFCRKTKKFDIAYIDGNHSYEGALSDTVLTWELAKHIIIWDDYGGRAFSEDYGVRMAVTAFLRNIPDSQYKVIADGYQFAIQKLG